MKIVIGAMKEELAELVKAFQTKNYNLIPTADKGFIVEDLDLIVYWTGIGLVNAGSGLSHVLTRVEDWFPEKTVDLIINIGTCGTSDLQSSQGDVKIIDQAVYGNSDATAFGYAFGQIPQMPATYQANQDEIAVLKQKLAEYNPNVVNIASSDVFVANKDIVNQVQTQLAIPVATFDMEATSLFQTAFTYNKPMISIKVISDVIGANKENQVQFDEFLPVAAKKISEIITKII